MGQYVLEKMNLINMFQFDLIILIMIVKIKIKDLIKDEQMVFEIDHEAYVKDLKEMIFEKLRIEVGQQMLLHNSKHLATDTEKIKAAGIKNDDFILLYTRYAFKGTY